VPYPVIPDAPVATHADARRASPVVLVVLLAFVTALSLWVRQAYWLDYSPGADEKDYRVAVRESFSSIYLGTNTTPFWVIARRYVSEPEFRAHPWASLAAGSDQLALRHFHTPLSFYPSAILGDWLRSNRAHRAFPILVSASCAPLVLLGGYWLGLSLTASLAGAVLIAVDGRLITASTILTPHPLYVFLSLAFVFAAGKLLQQPSRRHRLTVLALFGLAVACLELSPLLLLGAAGAMLLGRHSLVAVAGNGRERWLSLAWLLLVLTVAWPAGIWALGYATCYAVFGALALFHRGEYYGNAGAVDLYHRLFGDNPLLAIVALAAIGATVWTWRRPRSPLLPIAVSYGLLALGFNWLNRFRNATYAAETTVFLWLMLAAIIDDLARRGQAARIVAMGLTAVAAMACALELHAVL